MSDCGFLFLTESCNQTCAHCYVSARPGVGRHMPFHVVLAALDVLAAAGIRDVRLTGGEPTIHPKLIAVIDEAKTRNFQVGMATNGVRLMNRTWASKILPHLSRCWVSAYGINAEEHRRIGGAASTRFPELVAGVGAYSAEGFPVGLSVLIQPGCLDAVDALVLAAAGAGVKRLRFLPVQPDGRAKAISGLLWDNWPAELLAIATAIRKHSLRSQFDVLTLNDPFDLDRRFGEAISSCLVQRRQMWSITPNGDIFACCFTAYDDELRVANVLEEGAAEQLRTFSKHNIAACRALRKGFWTDLKASHAACPIGSVDLRVPVDPI